MSLRYPKTVPNALGHLWQCKENIAKAAGNETAANDARMIANVKQIIDWAIFKECDERGSRSIVKQSAIQELELLTVFLDYFENSCENNQLKVNTLFITLFPPSGIICSDRLQLLAKLVGLAIFTKNVAVLNAAGIWMQELGCTSEYSVKLADAIYLDLFVLVPEPLACLRDLPTLSPHFTANLLTTFTERFLVDEEEKFVSPPSELLTIITLWISKNPTLCMAALAVNVQLLMPRGTSPRPATSPFGGLIRWCVLAPLYCSKIDVGIEGLDLTGKNKEKNLEFSKLHLAIVQSANECYSHKQMVGVSIKDVVSVQQLCEIIESICLWVAKFEQKDGLVLSKNTSEKAITFAIDQFGLVIHLLLAANSVSGHLDDLVTKMKLLPFNKFLHIILDRMIDYALPI